MCAPRHIPTGPIVLLADTSAWIEFFRDTGTATCERLADGLADQEIVVTDPVIGEIMCGVRPHEVDTVEWLLSSQHYEPVLARIDWLDAAEIYRGCRRDGVTIRSQTDCLIAAAAIRLGLAVLHHDRDFDEIAARTRLLTA